MKLAKFARGTNMPARLGHKGFTLVEIMIVVLIIGILLAIAVPNFMKARETSRTKSCVSNLKQIQGAKEQWAMDLKKAGTEVPLATDIFGADKYIKLAPTCPANDGAYTLNSVDTNPACPYAVTNSAHALP